MDWAGKEGQLNLYLIGEDNHAGLYHRVRDPAHDIESALHPTRIIFCNENEVFIPACRISKLLQNLEVADRASDLAGKGIASVKGEESVAIEVFRPLAASTIDRVKRSKILASCLSEEAVHTCRVLQRDHARVDDPGMQCRHPAPSRIWAMRREGSSAPVASAGVGSPPQRRMS